MTPETYLRTKFIILSEQRSGSQYLADLLRSHNAVCVAGEIFNPCIKHCATDELTKNFSHLREEDPATFLEMFYNQTLNEMCTHIGFRLFHNHALHKPHRLIWKALQKMKRLKVIHLQRQNLLNNYLSLRLAERSNKWQRLEGQPIENFKPIFLEYDKLMMHIKLKEKNISRGTHFFRNHQMLNIFYEDFQEGGSKQLSTMLNFLNLSQKKLVTKHMKQNLQSNHELIINYTDLKKKLKRTRWHKYLED